MATSNKKYKATSYKTTQAQNAFEGYESEPYQNVGWDNSYRDQVDTSYYDTAKAQYNQMAEKDRATQLGQASQQYDSSLRSAYVQKMQNQKALNEALATSGIRGGATESSNIKLMNQYGQARNAAGTDYTNSVNSINQSIDRNKFEYAADMDARAEEYRQNMSQTLWNAAREDYANAYNARREDAINRMQAQQDINNQYAQDQNNAAINQWQRQNQLTDQKREDVRTEKQDKYEYWTNRWAGTSSKDLKSKRKSLQKKLSKGKLTAAQKRTINAQLEAIGRILGDRR